MNAPALRLRRHVTRLAARAASAFAFTLAALALFAAPAARAQLTFDPANPPASATPPTEEYFHFTGTKSHQKGPKALLMVHVQGNDKPWTSNIPTEATYLPAINSLSNRYYASSGHQTWVGPKRLGAHSVPRFHLIPVVVTLPRAATYYTSETFGTLQTDTIAAVRALGGEYASGARLDPNNFDRIMVTSNHKMISSTGLAYVGGKFSWPGGAYEHELGHNWGLYHANFWNIPNGATHPRHPDGASVEYGDGADIMGGGNTLFSALMKTTLGFLEEIRGEVLPVTTPGTFRLYSHSQGFARNPTNLVRALTLPVDANNSKLFLGFRYENTGAAAGGPSRNDRDRDAVQVHWNRYGALYVDTTPGSRDDDDKIDGSIKIGRTYSEPASVTSGNSTIGTIAHTLGGVHITPVARGSTTFSDGAHQWIDVTIHPANSVSPTNQPPAASFPATSLPGTAGAPLALAVTATDPEGDPLAYDWDFGDGTYNLVNSASQSPTFASPGLYLVRCTVSDMKGGSTTVHAWANIGAQPERPATPVNTTAGLEFRSYTGTWSVLPDFTRLQPVASGTTPSVGIQVKPSNDNFALLFSGFIEVPASDIYQFEIRCDDGARLTIAGQTVLTHDGLKTSATAKVGNLSLQAGKHPFRLEYFHKDGSEVLQFNWWRIGQPRQPVPASALLRSTYEANAAPAVAITSPAAGDSVIVNSDVAVTASATDADGITQVVFFANGSFLGTDTSAPFEVLWPRVSVGSQTLTAIAYDATGRWTQSAPLVFAVVSPAPTNGIGLNFGAVDVSRTLSFNEAAGAVYAYPNWNNFSANTGSALALKDHSGFTTPARLSFASDGTRSGSFASNADTSSANGKLMRGGLARDFDIEPAASPNPSATVTAIPYASYDVYVYFDALESQTTDAHAQRYVLTPSAGPVPAPLLGQNSLVANDGKGDFPAYDSWTGFREATATSLSDPASALAGNYVVFRSLTAPSFTVEATRRDGSTPANGTSGRMRRLFNALQIIQTTPTTPGLILRQTADTTAVSEAGATDHLAVSLAFAPTANVTVNIAPGPQLTTSTSTLTFTPANWQSGQTLTLGAVQDSAVEGAHTGTLTFTATGGNYTGLAASTLAVAITDDDQATVRVAATGQPAEAPSATGRFQFTRSGAASLAAPLTVAFQASGTASLSADFTFSGASHTFDSATGAGTVVLPAGQAQVFLTVTPTNDSTQEGPESLALTLPASAAYSADPATATLQIADDDLPDYFTQHFTTGRIDPTFDLVGKKVTFTPNGSPGYYGATLGNATAYPTPTTGHTDLEASGTLTGTVDDGFWTVNQPAKFFGTTYSTIYVGTNGYVTFGAGDTDYTPTLAEHFDTRRVSLFWRDLDPATNGNVYVGRVTTPGQERTVVTYHNVAIPGRTADVTQAQIEFFDSGVITLSWIYTTPAATNPVVGLSNLTTGALPSPFLETNFSALGDTASTTNAAPAFGSVPPLRATAGTPFAYAVAANDLNNDVLAFTAVAKPAWLTLTDHGDGTATLSGTPPAPGSAAVTLRVSDGAASADQTFSLFLAPAGANSAPTFTSSPAATTLSVGDVFSYAVTSADAESMPRSISATTLPSWLTLVDQGDGTATLSGTAPDTAVASHPVTLLVSDGLAASTQSFVLTLNRAPSVSLLLPASGSAVLPSRDTALALAASVADDGLPAAPGAVTTSWIQIAGPAPAVFADASAPATSATFPAPGAYHLRLTATDGAASTARDVHVHVETDPAPVLAVGLRGHWRFDEASGATAADASGLGRDLTLVGSVTFGPGVSGNAYNGSASDTQYGESTALPLTPALTFSAWVNSSVAPGDGGNERTLLVFMNGTSTQRAELYLPSGSTKLRFRSAHSTAGVWELSSFDLPANEWVHLAVAYDHASTANHPAFYVNGTLASSTRITAPSGSVNTTDRARLGGSGGNLNQAWRGRLDEARLYDRVVPPAEVALLRLATAVNQAPLVEAALRDPLPAGAASAVLAGLATDDGLPAFPGAVTTSWIQVSGPAAAVFSDPSALDSTVTFPASGNYVLRLSASDGEATSSSDLPVVVSLEPAAATTLSVAPATTTVAPGASAQFSADLRDQFDQPIAGAITWSVSGGGSISATGLFTAGTSEGGPFTVTATHAALGAQASVTVFDQLPTVTAPADLSVLAGSSSGPLAFTVGDAETATGSLVVTATSSNQTVLPDANLTLGGTGADRTITVAIPSGQNGSAVVTLTVNDGVKSASATFTITASTVSVATLSVTPGSITIAPGGSAQFTATPRDSGGQPILPPPAVTWSVSDGGTIDTSGLFTAGTTPGGPFTVTATAGSVSGTATITVTNTAPSVSILDPALSPIALPDRTDTLLLEASATDAESTPTLAWTQVSGPASATFTNASAAVTGVTFPADGTYVLRVTASDGLLTDTAELTVQAGSPGGSTGSAKSLLLDFGTTPATGQNTVDATATPALGGPAALTGSLTYNVLTGSDNGQNLTAPASYQYSDTSPAAGVSVTAYTGPSWTNIRGGPAAFTRSGVNNGRSGLGVFASATYADLVAAANSGTNDYLSLVVSGLPAGTYTVYAITNNTYLQSTGAQTRVVRAAAAAASLADYSTLPSVTLNYDYATITTDTATWSAASGKYWTSFTITLDAANPALHLGGFKSGDNQGGVFNAVQIVGQGSTVPAAPSVNPGSAPASPETGLAATLAGSVTGASPTAAWSLVSGPGAAAFADASAPATTVTFSAPGAYVLRLAASNDTATVYQDLAVAVAPPAAPDFASWISGYDVGPETAPDDDPDRDGSPNLLEFALGGHPDDPGQNPALIVAAAPGELTLTYTRRADLAGVQVAVLTSTALAADSWSSAGVTEEVLSTADGFETVRATVSLDGATRRFLLVRATAP